MTRTDLELALRTAWTELALHAPQARPFRSRRISTALSLDAHAGLRAVDHAPCLLLDAQAPADALFEAGGMRLSRASDEHPLLVLSLEDAARVDLFATVCSDALSAALDTQPDEALTSFLARIDAWRRFLRDRRAGLTLHETIGLIGELAVIRRLLEADAQLLASWSAPDAALHDFARAGHALEIKSTMGPATALHVSNLDQLDASGLRRLDLLHVRLVEAPDGECLEQMIEAIGERLASGAARRSFDNALLRRGLMPDDTTARSSPRVLLQNLTAYSVGADFPRLARSSVPSAVLEAEYLLQLRSIDRHAVDAEAVLRAFSERTTE